MEFGKVAWFADKAEEFLVKYGDVPQDKFDILIENAALDILMPESNTIEKALMAPHIDGFLFAPDNYLQAKVKAIKTILDDMNQEKKLFILGGVRIKNHKPYPKELLTDTPDVAMPNILKTVRNVFTKEGRELTKAASNVRNKSMAYLYKTPSIGHAL